jgi:hypothetical protein
MTIKTSTIIVISVLIAISTYLAYPKVVTFFEIDSCLDQGGRWNYKDGNCDQGLESQNKTLSKEGENLNRQTTQPTGQEVTLATKIPANVDSNFKTFLKYFSQDSLFQVSRIDFPLKVKNIEEDEQEVEIIINKRDFHKLTFGDSTAATRQYDKHEEKIRVNGNTAVIETRGIDNGIYYDVKFEKIAGKWKLLTWVDSST